jgi:hypothetical protein
MVSCSCSASARRCSGVLVVFTVRAISANLSRSREPVSPDLSPPRFFAVKAMKSPLERTPVVQPRRGGRGREFRRGIRERSDRVPEVSEETTAKPFARRVTERMLPKASRQRNKRLRRDHIAGRAAATLSIGPYTEYVRWRAGTLCHRARPKLQNAPRVNFPCKGGFAVLSPTKVAPRGSTG